MADLSILAILSFFDWLSIDRRSLIGVLLCIALAIALGVSNA